MDKGAHFHRCDFQVHSPRDINWGGPRPSSEEERGAYAEAFIAACRSKQLHGVAITDHHDTVFFKYIKEAALNETDSEGNLLPEESRVVVFPGMELTLGIPCQALLILDSEFPVGLLPTLNTILASPCNDPNEPKHGPTVRLEHIKELKQLYECLDQQEHLKGRYIILPNVGESGNFSILRKGFTTHYKNMPCVGGYTDGLAPKSGTGNHGIVEGKNKDYGHKPIGVFQTSDNRSHDFEKLGLHSTWVKWATPTAEALRQACLAKSTRISQDIPKLPSHVVDYIDVSNSKFLGPFTIEFNAQYNCLIGGRGTGKSTILEYIRWALCDQPPSLSNQDDLSDFHAKRATLIEKTLVPLKSTVTVGFRVNNVPHAVRRNSATQELFLRIDNQPFVKCREDDVRDLLSIRAYSQKQLSAVGVRTEELIRFIQAPMKQQLADMSVRINELKSKIRTVYGVMQEKRTLQKDEERDRLEVESLTKQLTALRSQLKGLTEEDQTVLSTHDAFLEEEQAVEGYQRELSRARSVIDKCIREVRASASQMDFEKYPNGDTLRKLSYGVSHALQEAGELVGFAKAFIDVSSANMRELNGLFSSWTSAFQSHSSQYEAAKQKATSQQALLKQISETEDRIKAVRSSLTVKRERLSSLGAPEQHYRSLRQQWTSLFQERANSLKQKCDELTSLSANRIAASLKHGHGVDKAQERLTAMMVGTKIRSRRHEDLFALVVEAEDPHAQWERILREFEELIQAVQGEESAVELPHTPILELAGYNNVELDKLARKLSPQDWLELSLTELEDKPVFMYAQRENEYIKFEDASAGQQATALLRVLLNQEGPPLLIDQPEEDLDNQVILEIVSEIWKAKKNRQIIFTSHNANIVVNGDADLVVCCDYRAASDQSGGRVKCLGAIDVPEIRKEITVVMEGGREAFRLRRDKYGF